MARSGAELDQLADLEEQRRFLLDSLDDLEREHAAGDVSPTDYATLKDDYTARAAAVLRAIDEQRTLLAPRPPRRWGRLAAGLLVAVGSIAGITAILVSSTAERQGAVSPTGDAPVRDAPLSTADPRIAQAQALELDDPLGALKLYGSVAETAPADLDKAIALTWQGWLAYRLGRQVNGDAQSALFEVANRTLNKATELAPDRPEAYCFLAVVRYRAFDDEATAKPALRRCVAGIPPPEVAPLVSNLQAELGE